MGDRCSERYKEMVVNQVQPVYSVSNITENARSSRNSMNSNWTFRRSLSDIENGETGDLSFSAA
jgi:hypothetical protein